MITRVLAVLVLSSPAAAQLDVRGEPELVGKCQVAEVSQTPSLLQGTKVARTAQVMLTDERGQHPSSNSKEKKSGASQQSIFTLPVSKINEGALWLVSAVMLLITIIVDRGLAYLDYITESSERAKLLLERMNSELVMFGVVAICLFVISNLVTVEEKLFLQIEYVDILCSLSCIFLLEIVAVFFVIFNHRFNEWQHFEEYPLNKGEIPDGDKMDAQTYKTLALEFKKRHRLPRGFVFLVYLRECFVADCCDIMNVRWYLWAFLMVSSLVFYLVRGETKSTVSDSDYLQRLFSLHMAVCFCFFAIASFISLSYRNLVKSAVEIAERAAEPPSDSLRLSESLSSQNRLPSDSLSSQKRLPSAVLRESQSSQKSPRDPGDKGDYKEDKTLTAEVIVHFIMQLLAVVNAFLLVHFVMHEVHLIYEGNVSRWWYLSCTPLVVNFCLLLPVSLMRMSFVDAYCNTNSNALDAMLTELHKLEGDIRYVQMLWEHKGSPEPTIEGDLDLKAFRHKLLNQELNLYVNDKRARRLFTCFDLDHNGTVSVTEFMQVLNGTVSQEVLQDSQKKSISDFRYDGF